MEIVSKSDEKATHRVVIKEVDTEKSKSFSIIEKKMTTKEIREFIESKLE